MRILVVDDTPSVLYLMARILDRLGFEDVVEARDGFEAIGLFDGSFDLVITDWEMPRVDGLGLVKAIRRREEGGKVAILMVTSHSSFDRREEALRAGVDGFLVKPFTFEDFKKRIEVLSR